MWNQTIRKNAFHVQWHTLRPLDHNRCPSINGERISDQTCSLHIKIPITKLTSWEQHVPGVRRKLSTSRRFLCGKKNKVATEALCIHHLKMTRLICAVLTVKLTYNMPGTGGAKFKHIYNETKIILGTCNQSPCTIFTRSWTLTSVRSCVQVDTPSKTTPSCLVHWRCEYISEPELGLFQFQLILIHTSSQWREIHENTYSFRRAQTLLRIVLLLPNKFSRLHTLNPPLYHHYLCLPYPTFRVQPPSWFEHTEPTLVEMIVSKRGFWCPQTIWELTFVILCHVNVYCPASFPA